MSYQKTLASLAAAMILASAPVFADTNTSPVAPNAIPGNLLSSINDSVSWTLHNYGGDKVKAALVESEYPTAIKIKVDAVDGTNWHARMESLPNLMLADGQVYTLRFWAKADAPRDMGTYAQITDGDFHGVGLGDTQHLGTDWAPYTQTFMAKDASGHKSIVNLLVGQQTGTVWISGMSLMRGAFTSIKEPVADPRNWTLDQTPPTVLKAVPEAGSIKFIISSVSSEAWSAQAYQTGFLLTGGADYQVSFMAKADSPRPMDVTILDMETYKPIGVISTTQLTTDWKLYTPVFHIPAEFHGLVRLPNLILGSKVGVVWVRNISLKKL